VAELVWKLELPSRPDSVGMCRLAVAQFAGLLGFTLAEIEEAKVAVSEAATNAVVHGYRGTSGPLRLTLREVPGGMAMEVGDEGCGIPDVRAAMQPSYSQDPERMGLGFVFMGSFTDTLDVASEVGRGTTVRMLKMREEAQKEEAR